MKIKRIVEIYSDEPVYDIEVSTLDHTFLIDKVRVENCRLLSDTQKLDAFVNSIGGTALSVGSCRVSTINLVRIAYEALNYNSDRNVSPEVAKKRYIKILRDRVLLDCKALYSMRHILKRNIEKGLLPNYQEGAVELDKQFCTIGGIGMYEVMDLFNLINTDEFGNKSYSDEAIEFATEILDNINDVKDNFEQYYEFDLEGKHYELKPDNIVQVVDEESNKTSSMPIVDAYMSEKNLKIIKVC